MILFFTIHLILFGLGEAITESQPGNLTSCDLTSWALTNTHIHAIPPAYAAAIAAAGGDPSGFPTPDWSLNGTLASLDLVGSARGVLSISTPGVPIAGTGKAARKLCRELNIYMEGLVRQIPSRLDFFAALPDWRDVNGTLAEIEWIFCVQKRAVGVGFYTGYGDKLPGDPMFKPIWDRLEQLKALTFMHPGVMVVKPLYIGGFLPQPIVDFPQQTTRAAVDLVLSGTRSRTPNVDMILSHAGGTLPFISERVVGSLIVPQIANSTTVNITQVASEFARYYYDIALSGTSTQLNGLLDISSPSHVLMGSDYPYTPQIGIQESQAQYLAWAATHPQMGPEVLTVNAKREILAHKMT